MKYPLKLLTAGVELTLACNCRCITCGSSAGKPRKNELKTDEMFALFTSLSNLGCKYVSFLGGEPFLRSDWWKLAGYATSLGLSVDIITSGVGFKKQYVSQIIDAGIKSITVSVDGNEDIHNKLRGVEGSYRMALRAIELSSKGGVKVGVTTQVNRLTLPSLEKMVGNIEIAGAIGWQLQLTLPTGNAILKKEILISCYEMKELYFVLRRLRNRKGLKPFITDSIGYFTPDEPILRSLSNYPERFWLGCFAGLSVIGITSNGGVKGCLSLPDSFLEGNIRKESLEKIWNDMERFSYNRKFNPENLSGPCKACVYGKICRGGCTATAVTFYGAPNRNSHCFRLFGGDILALCEDDRR